MSFKAKSPTRFSEEKSERKKKKSKTPSHFRQVSILKYLHVIPIFITEHTSKDTTSKELHRLEFYQSLANIGEVEYQTLYHTRF